MIVSVIIPVFNGEEFIKQAIDSALRQSETIGIEVIVVNDGSTDRTEEILKDRRQDEWDLLKRARFRYINKKNGGPASALNLGILNARGEWIKWLSADDVMKDDCIETLMKYVTDKDCIYYTHYHIIDQNGKHKRDLKEPVRDESDLWKFFYGNGSSSIIHRSGFDTCGYFDETLPHSEDYEFWLRATQIFKIRLRLIPEFTISYRNHPGQLTHKVGGTLDAKIKAKIKSQLASR